MEEEAPLAGPEDRVHAEGRPKRTLVQKMAMTLARRSGWPPASQRNPAQRAVIQRWRKLQGGLYTPESESENVES
jgi:hypothetical protein